MGCWMTVDLAYGALVRDWLRDVPPEGALLFCHPGEAEGLDAADPIAPARPRELAYLAGDAFARDLEAAAVTLGPVWQVSGTTTSG